ncbi:MAG: hypothetical protein AAF196_18830 [Planctomycetota bacterium]
MDSDIEQGMPLEAQAFTDLPKTALGGNDGQTEETSGLESRSSQPVAGPERP